VLNDIDETQAKRAAYVINAMGGKCHPFAGDAADVGFLQLLIDEAVKKYSFLSIVIANAGITSFGDFWDYQPGALQKVIDLNLTGSFFLTQKAAIQMKKQGYGGSILLMSSVTGHQAHKNLAAYGMTKAGIEMLAKNLVIELSPYNISINAVAPGATLTERTLEDANYPSIWSSITPMRKAATVEDIANAVLFFVHPASRHITGQTLIVDGGWTAVSPSPY
jgi:3-oxoacyl-[acyl-carrier protein] reductase